MVKVNCFIVLFLSLTIACNAQSKWVEDIAFLKNELPKKHINFFFQLEQKRFDAELDALSLKIDEMKDVDIVLSLQQMIAKAGDSHTGIGYQRLLDRNKCIPLEFYWFDDGIYVLSTINKYEHLLGSRLEKVGNHPIAEIIDSIATLIVQDNDALNKNFIPKLVTHTQILSFFEFIPNDSTPVYLSFIDINGKQVQEFVLVGEKEGDLISVKTKETPLFRQNPEVLFWGKYFDNGVYYVQYNTCGAKEVVDDAIAEYGKEAVLAMLGISEEEVERIPSFKNFTENIFLTANEKPIKRFIFDMRFNGGGSSDIGQKFVRQLKENEKLNKEGVLYVIIGRKTFSSAINNTMDFKNETKAVTVGEETGGKPNHYGQVESFKLPNSGVSIQYSTKYFRLTTEKLNTITPDIKVKYNFVDYLNGIDPSMNAILKSK